MDILLPDLRGPEAVAVADRLRAAGHQVLHCRTDGAACSALVDDGCPFDTAAVDVAVQVAAAEVDGRLGQGDVCAVRRRVPLVVVGSPDHALAPWAAAVVDAPEVVGAVAEVGEAPLPLHTAAASDVLAAELERLGADPGGRVEVRRHDGILQLELWPPHGVSRELAERIAVHLTQAVRGVDPWARGVDVAVHPAGSG